MIEFNKDILSRLEAGELNLTQEIHDYILYLDKKNLPAFYSLKTLADYLGFTPLALSKMCRSQEDFYTTFYIPKRSGGMRRIDAPLPTISAVQRYIVENILTALPYCKTSSKAYIKGCSIKDHVTGHLNQKCLVKLDIKNFFPNITINLIFDKLEELGYNSTISSILANLLTLNGVLPQGAPSSPLLCNIVSYGLDTALSNYCNNLGLTYTRYADDLLISGDHINESQLAELTNLVLNSGFEINESKTKIYTLNNKIRHATGLVLCGDKIRIPKKTRRKIRQTLHYVEKFLLSDLGYSEDNKYSQNLSIEDPIILERLIGHLSFWSWIEPDCEFAVSSLTRVRELRDKIDSL